MLIEPGYWQTTYFPDWYWVPNYWPIYTAMPLAAFSPTVAMPHAEIYAHGSTDTITSVAVNDWDKIEAFDTNGWSHGILVDETSRYLTCINKGRYRASFHWCGTGPAAAHDWEFHISKNGNASQFTNVTAHVTTPAAQNDESISASGIIDLAVSDTVELWVKRTSAGDNIDLVTKHCNLCLDAIWTVNDYDTLFAHHYQMLRT